ncbi:cardiolipin synthase [Microbacterium sp. LRZ72]|uniref:cardiolipin synthase n=1 Tax=Microbacterium sp. LRZ72 TaxID=2942481 RepID=UPI0029AF92F8|nr:cardiolipin synthase [Microbacterium sp. LRZ72]MDX2375511.1 cardiolipin synthase [Microbacterium sp. LRZ72]
MLSPSFLSWSPPLWFSALALTIDMIIRVVALGVVPHNRRPSAAWGWLLAIFFVPIVGVVLYLVIGRLALPEPRRRRQAAVPTIAGVDDAGGRADWSAPSGAADHSAALPEWVRDAVRLNRRLTGLPLVPAYAAEVLIDYTASLERITRAVEGARRAVHLQFYIFAADASTEPLIRAVEKAHARGVEVKVLMDHIGSLGFPGYAQLVRRLDRGGIPWHRMLPVRPWRGEYQRPDIRNHRKIAVIDDEVAFVGSQNLIDASYNKKKNLRKHLQWRDLMLRVEGPVVAHVDAVFLADWSSESGDAVPPAPPAAPAPMTGPGRILCQVLPSGAGDNPGKDEEANLRLFSQLFYSARTRIIMTSPYFVPEESTLVALTTAAQRGVDVRLYVGEASDHPLTHRAQRSYYEMLLRAGVTIHRHRPPYILHSKFLLIDEDVAIIASSNVDMRSFALNLELDLMVCDRDFVRRMDTVVAAYEDDSSTLGLDEWMSRPLRQKYIDNVCRLTASLQ